MPVVGVFTLGLAFTVVGEVFTLVDGGSVVVGGVDGAPTLAGASTEPSTRLNFSCWFSSVVLTGGGVVGGGVLGRSSRDLFMFADARVC